MAKKVVEYDGGIDPSFLDHEYGNKPYLPSLIEMIKNARDASAMLVWIITNLAKNTLRVVDDGTGILKRGMISWVGRPDEPTPGQAGKFGTGRLMMLFSWATSCVIRTVCKDDPESVWTTSFTKEEFSGIATKRFNGGKLSWEAEPKSRENWPYDFPTGSEFTFELEKPSRASILRGTKLAEELSARLPDQVLDAIRIDTERKKLPAKKIIGQKFNFCEEVEHLELLTISIYRLEKKQTDDALRLGGVELGEVPLANLRSLLLPHQKEELPEIFTALFDGRVCGVIIAAFFGRFVNPDRFTMSPDIADAPEMRHFLRLLARLAPEIQAALEIQVSNAPPSQANEEVLNRLHERFYQKFGKGQRPPEEIEVDNDKKRKPPVIVDVDDGRRGPKPKALRLHILDKNGEPCDEFELGETIVVEAEFGQVQQAVWSHKNIVWRTEDACADRVKKTATGISLIANQVGEAFIQADVTPPTGTATTAVMWATARYKVVENRAFRLSLEGERTIKIGDICVLFGINTDKLRGDLQWQHSGDGELEIAGKRATFKAIRRGAATIKASDKGNPNVSSTCAFIIEGNPPKLFPIKEHWFAMKHVALAELKRPVEMREVSGRDGKVHKIVVNPVDPSFLAAQAAGPASLEQFLLQAIALEYPRFTRIALKRLDPNRDVDEIPEVLEEMLKEGYEILGTLLVP